MAGQKHPNPPPDGFRNTPLSDALQTGDIAAVAFALRHGPTVVPLTPSATGDVWTYRDPRTGDLALLLFSDAGHKPATLPPDVTLKSPTWLRRFLGAREHEMATVFFDVAGPYPMQATPADLIAALDA